MKMKDNKETELSTVLKKKTFWVRLREEKYLQIMALLGVLWMLVFNYAPMYGILVAFKKNYKITTPLFSWKFLTSAWAANGGFQHFINFFKDMRFGIEPDLFQALLSSANIFKFIFIIRNNTVH